MPKHLHPLGVLSDAPVPCESGLSGRAATFRRPPLGCCRRSDNRLSRSGPKPFSEPGVLSPKRPVAVPHRSGRSLRRGAGVGPLEEPKLVARSDHLRPLARPSALRSEERIPSRRKGAARGQPGDAIAPVSTTWPSRAGRLPSGPKRPVALSRLGPGRPSGVSPDRRWKRTRAPRGAQAEMRVSFRVSTLLFAFGPVASTLLFHNVREREISSSFWVVDVGDLSYGARTAPGKPEAGPEKSRGFTGATGAQPSGRAPEAESPERVEAQADAPSGFLAW